MGFVDWQEYRRWRERKEPTSKALHPFDRAKPHLSRPGWGSMASFDRFRTLSLSKCRVNLEPLGLSSGRRQAPIFGWGSREVHWFTWVIAATGVLQGGLFTGKSAGCSAFLPVGRGGEGGNGLPQWSQSRPCNHNYISRKPRPLGR